MSVGSGVPYNAHTGNGVTTVFAYGFTLLDAADLVVTINGVVTSAYTVSGLGVAAGGSITFSTAPANGAAVLLERVIQLVRATEYPPNGDFQSETINNDLDRLWMAVQNVGDVASRAVRVGVPETLSELGVASIRLDKLLYFASSTGAIGLSSFTHTQLASAVAAAYSAGSTADAVAFVADGSGAVSRTAQAKLRERVDVADFGADPANSAAVNTAAIAAAVTACGAGRTLYFSKPGLYTVEASVVDTAIQLPIGVDLEMAPGAWLTADTAFGSFITPLGRNRIRCNIDGAGYPTSGGVTGTWTLENVGIRAYFSTELGRGAADVIVEGCRIKNVTYAVQTEGSQRWRIVNNTFERCKLTAVLLGFLPSFDCANNIVSSNTFDDLGDYAVAFWQASGVSGEVAFNAVTNNWARNCNQATNGYAFGVEQGDVTRQHHMLFANNVYETDGSVSVTVGGITISTCRDSAVIGNILSCPTTTQAKGINCVSSLNCLISGNTLDGWSDTAIDTDGSDGVTLDANVIRDCGGASTTYPAVRLAATLTTSNIRMSGGSITISSGYALSGTAVAAVRALVASTRTVKNITIKGVTFTNPNDRAISLEGISGAPILNAEVSGCTVIGIGSGTFFGREVVNAEYVNDLTVSDNVVMDAKRGIVASNCDGVTLSGNEFKGSQTISTLYDITASSNLRIRDDIVSTTVTTALTPTARMSSSFGNSARGNTSFLTEAWGTSGSIASGATVTHGLFAAPTQVFLTPAVSGVTAGVTAKGSTTFTVGHSSGAGVVFDWHAVIR